MRIQKYAKSCCQNNLGNYFGDPNPLTGSTPYWKPSVCLTMKNVLSLNSSHNNSSVDDVPSHCVTPFKVLSTNRAEFSRSTVQLVDKVDS